MNYSQFTPVDPDFYEIIESYQKLDNVVIHYFDPKGEVETARGRIIRLSQMKTTGDFLFLHDESKVRIDRIITINGRPGPAYDEYDSYALQCTTCMGGMD